MVCRFTNRHSVKYAELRIGILLKVCRFVIRHITQTQTETLTEANFTHVGERPESVSNRIK